MKNDNNLTCQWNEYDYMFRPYIIKSETDKTAALQYLYPHYSNVLFSRGQTHSVFGKEQADLEYIYSDRLDINFWQYCRRRAIAEGAQDDTAEMFEHALKHYYDDSELCLYDIKTGIRVSDGGAYQIFGFTYKELKQPITVWREMRNLPEFLAIKESHTLHLMQKQKLDKVVRNKKTAKEQIRDMQKKIKQLERKLPRMEQERVKERAKTAVTRKKFTDLKNATNLPMPYHEHIYIY